VLAGSAISRTGDWIYIVTLLVYVFEQKHSAYWVAAASIARIAPSLFMAKPARAVVERLGPRNTLLVSDLGRAVLMLFLALAAMNDNAAALAIGLACVSTIIGAPSIIARDAAIASIAGEDELAHARGAATTIEHVALIVGQAGAGILLVFGSAYLGFALNALTFALSSLVTTRIHARAQVIRKRTPLREVPSVARSVLAERGAGMMLVAVVVATVAYGSELVLSVLISEDLLKTGSQGVGFLKASVGVGGVAAAFLFGRATLEKNIRDVFAFACAAAGIPLVLVAYVDIPAVACLLMFSVGLGNVALDVISITLVRRAASAEVAHHLFTVMDHLGVAAVVAGSIIAPALVAQLGLRATLVGTGSLLVFMFIPVGPALARLQEIAAERSRRLAPIVEMMRNDQIFRGASRSALELMAASATPISIPAGTMIVRQGDEPDSFYLVKSGELDVQIDGRTINHLGPDDHFGEIGFIEHVQRTASVIATTDCELYRIKGTDFLAALDREPALAGPLTESALARLSRTPE
jgi:hypothetical protein